MISSRWIAVVLIALCVPGGAAANTAASFGPYQAVEVTGNDAVSANDVAAVAAAFEGRSLALEDLQALADSLIEPCERAALALCRADIPASGTTGKTLRIDISEGYVVRIEADEAIGPVVRRVLQPVLAERPLTEATLRRAVANLDEITGLDVSSVRPRRLDGDTYALVVRGSYRRRGLRGIVTNRGSRRADPWRSILVADAGSVALPGDRVQIAYLTRPESPDELSYGVLRYQTGPTRQGTTTFVELNASQSSPQTILDGRDASGSLYRAVLGLKAPLLRRVGARLDATVSFETVRSAEEEEARDLYTDELRILRGSVFAERRSPSLRLTGQATVSRGLDALSAAGGSRPDGEVAFWTVAGEGSALVGLGKTGFVKVAASLQASDSPLFFQEEYSFGGGSYGRGYDYGEIRGDAGAAAYVEVGARLRVPSIQSSVTPYLFADGGAVWNEGVGSSIDGRALWSAGGGVRAQLPYGFSAQYEAAMPLSDAPFTEDDEDLRHRVQVSFTTPR